MEIKDHKLHGDTGHQVEFIPSPHMRGKLVHRMMLIHGTEGGTLESTVSHFQNKDSHLHPSAHLVIGRDGIVVQMVPFDRIAQHAGWGKWGKIRDISKYSIGIELVNAGPLEEDTNDGEQKWVSLFKRKYGKGEVETAKHPHKDIEQGWHTYPEKQITTLIAIARLLKNEYPLEEILGHYDVTSKWDPGPVFPMEEVRTAVYGKKELNDTQNKFLAKKRDYHNSSDD